MKLNDLPTHEIPALNGNNAPVDSEDVFDNMPVIGEVPADLNGLYVRNGPNPFYPPDWRYHAYDGDGMVHAIRFQNGKVTYRNRWIQTRQLNEHARTVGPDGTRNLGAGPANTHVIRHAGRTLAVAETTSPWEVTRDLDTVGVYDFGGRLATGMTAHPKICATTGEAYA